ncbi:MAG: putative transporter [Euryarchaeota archaeon ADurb.BinA087]|nr:MAG: putative transporter [Euryarchaeota archaeon ADurb.BinA087]HQA80072.1 MFS transporter [Methanoregulaceae archaeon]
MSDPANSSSRGVVLVIVTIGTFLNPFTGSSINLALPLIGEEFAIDAIMLSWIPAAYLLSSAIFLLPAGMLGDITGRARVFSTGTLVYTFASLLAFFSPSASLLLACRFLQGIGGAMLYSTAIAIIADLYPPGERGRAVGINVMAVYGGMTLGPFIGGILTQLFGWRSIFFITVLLGCIVLLYVRRIPQILNESRRETFDYQGAILSAVALVLFFIGTSRIPKTDAFVFILLSGLTFLIFYHVESGKTSPLFPITLFSSNRTFSFSNLAALINYSATFAVTFLLSLYLQIVRGMSPAAAGSILLIQPFIQMVIAPVAGRLSDRTDTARLASIGLFTSSAGLLGLAFLGMNTALSWVVLFLILLGCGLGLFSTPNTTVVMGSVEKSQYGIASSFLATMRSTGMMLSMGIVMIVFSMLLGSTSITPELSQGFLASMQIIFVVFFVLTILGALISLDKKNPDQRMKA